MAFVLRRRIPPPWTPARGVATVVICIAGVLAFAFWPVGFAFGTACTTHYSCGSTCVPACDRVGLGTGLDLFGQVGVIVILAVGLTFDRLHSVWIVLAALALSAEIAWAGYQIAGSWSAVH